MMKRHIAIPLLCVVLVAALSIPIFAAPEDSSTFPYPENNFSGMGSISFNLVSAISPTHPSGVEWFDFGDMWIGHFVYTSDFEDYGLDCVCSFALSVNVPGSFYIAWPTGVDYYFTGLSEYRDPSLDYNVDFGDEWPCVEYRPSSTSDSFITSESVAPVKVTFYGYSDVPVGDYTLTANFMSNPEVLLFGVYASGNSSGSGSGVTGDSGYDGYNKIVDKYINGTLTYTEALDELGDRYDFIHTTDIYQNLLYVNEYQMSVSKLNGLVSSSAAEKSADLDAQMSATVDQFADGSIDLKDAMDTLSSNFSTSLSGAQTVEEAAALTSVYQVKLLQLENANQVKLMEGLDAVITDEEIQKADDYYAAEDELVNAFDVATFDAQLQFDLWWLQMPRNETIEYKKFFDYLMNESDIKYFITIPLAMSLVAIIMGTRMRTRPDRVVERSTTVDSGGSRTTTVKYKND